MNKTIALLSGVLAGLLWGGAAGGEPVPLNVGEVAVPIGRSNLWEFKGVNRDAAIKSKHVTPTTVSLRYYAKQGTGSFTMSRAFEALDCTGFDEFVFFFNNSGETLKVTLTVGTDAGERKSGTANVRAEGHLSWTELAAPLQGAKSMNSLSVAFTFDKQGAAGSDLGLHGLILRNTQEYAAFLKHWERFAKLKWDDLLQPPGFRPEFKLSYGLFFNDEDVEAYRSRYGKAYAEHLDEWRRSAAPEPAIGDYIYSGEECRQRLCDRYTKVFGGPCMALRRGCSSLAFAGLVTRDADLMRLAARYALSVASFASWNDRPKCDRVGGGVWPAFIPSGVALSLAYCLDCAGEMLTARGREYVMKAMMLKGVGPITYSLWARSYAFKGNQCMVFLRGKMGSLLAFDKAWPRVGPMIRNTKAEADECMNILFRPDGSYMESLSYMAYTISCAAPLYEMYARNSGRKLTEILPENIRNSAGFADVVSSTSRHPDRAVIAIGQCRSWKNLKPLCAAFMAAAAPGSMWVNLYKRITPEEMEQWYPYRGLQHGGIRLLKLTELAGKSTGAEPRPLVLLKHSGLLSSTRRLNGQPVKIVVVGDAADMGKKHDDVGSFVLEFAGDAFAVDLPAYHGLYAEARYHNLLLPVMEDGRLAASLPPTHPSIYGKPEKRNSQSPEGVGDETSLAASVNPSDTWAPEHFRKWVRKIESPTPDLISIIDEYQLGAAARGAAFIWVAHLPLEVKGDRVLITGEYGGRAELTIPPGCELEIDRFDPGAATIAGMALPKGHKCTRLIIRKNSAPNATERLEVQVRLSCRKAEQAPAPPAP